MRYSMCFLIVVVALLGSMRMASAQNEYIEMVEETGLTHSKAMAIMTSMVEKVHELYADDPDFLERFDASQSAWEAYRLSHIGALFPGGRENYGSSFSFCGPLESLKLVKERIKIIEQWITGAPEGDVCSGTIRRVSIEEYEKAVGPIPVADE